MSYRSPVVPLLFANLTARPVTIPKSKILADDYQASPVNFKRSKKQLPLSNELRTVASALQQSKAV